MENKISREAKEILAALAKYKNVLISGAPATGKSRVLNEVADAFINFPDYISLARPIHDNASAIPIPRTVADESNKNFPVPNIANRKVFRTTFHQNTK